MSAINAPFGLRPINNNGGVTRPYAGGAQVASGFASNIYSSDPVAINSSGNLILATAGSTNRLIGAFQGIEYIDATGKPTYSNFWPAGLTATVLQTYYTRDPFQTYEVQCVNNTGFTTPVLAQANVGVQAALIAGVGNYISGSAWTLDTSTITNSGSAQLRVIGFSKYVDNAIGDPANLFPVVQVQIAQHQDVASQIAY